MVAAFRFFGFSPLPNRRSNTKRGLTSLATGVDSLRHETLDG
jgi:hypothetical protein